MAAASERLLLPLLLLPASFWRTSGWRFRDHILQRRRMTVGGWDDDGRDGVGWWRGWSVMDW